MPARQLFLHVRGWICGRHTKPVNPVLETLALLVRGLSLGRSAQLWEIAVWIPWDIQLTSGVRGFERWLADRTRAYSVVSRLSWGSGNMVSDES